MRPLTVSSGLLAELAELKKEQAQPHKRRFERFDFVVKGIYFISFVDAAIDPFRVAAHILQDVKTTQLTNTRYEMGWDEARRGTAGQSWRRSECEIWSCVCVCVCVCVVAFMCLVPFCVVMAASRFTARVLPVAATCYSSIEAITPSLTALLTPALAQHVPASFSVQVLNCERPTSRARGDVRDHEKGGSSVRVMDVCGHPCSGSSTHV
jgi:hypothetical protein